MSRLPRRKYPLALESLEERRVLSASAAAGHALADGLHLAALKISPPKISPPKISPPKISPPKINPPKINPPKINPPKINPPKVNPPKVNPPKINPPKVNPPKINPPKLPTLPKPPKLPPINPGGALHELAGEAGRAAYSAAAATMAARNGNRTPHRLTVEEQKALKPYFGDLAGRVTIYYGADPLNAWSGGGYTVNLGGTDASAQTYGLNVYIRSARENMSDYARLKLVIHELTHSQQYEKYGSSLSDFGYHYFKEWSKGGRKYDANAMEREASAAESSLIDKVYAAYQAAQAPATKTETVSYTIRNDSGRTVSFKMQPSGKSYTLAPGKTASYSSQKINGVAPTLTVTSTGRTYNLVAGDHKFWWMTKENRVGFDMNYKK